MEQTISSAETEIAQALEKIWREVLETENVSADSDFFQLGGDSLQMMTMLFRISREMGLDVEPGTVFDNPTIGLLARFLADGTKITSSPVREGML